NPVVYVDPSGQSWVSDWLDDVGLGFINDLWEPAVVMVAGAVGMTVCGPSCAMAAAGATDYAITGSIESAVASAAQTGLFIAAGDFSSGDADWIKVSAHVGAGAASGAIRAGLTGGNLGRAAFTGGVSAGFAEYAGLKLFGENKLLPDKYTYRLPVHAAVGGIIGGFANELFGGSFKEGFYQGLRSGAFGATFNWLFHGPMFFGRWTVYPRWLSRWIYKVQDIAP
ncbi:MAG TPA: hypothetical protein PKM59_15955, partial [Thermodesulfobacteriota bacterium]|nr:hypothetical protein [Thermodesulfobacteriota bacterium]